MFRVILVFDRVPCFLSFEVDLVFLNVRIEQVVCGHPEYLGQTDQKVQQINHLHARILFIESLIFCPPLPWHAVC